MQKLFDAFRHYIIKHPREEVYKPSSPKYDGNQLIGILKKLDPLELDFPQEEIDKVMDFVHISDYLHNLYIDFYTTVQQRLADFNMKGEDIVEFFITFLNREWKTIIDKVLAAPKSLPKGTYLYQDMVNHKLQLEDGTKLDVQAVLEGATDAVSMLCNFMRHMFDKEFCNEAADPKWFTANLRDIFQMADVMATFKYSYDNVLYDSIYVKMDKDKKTIAFYFENDRNEMLKRLGNMIIGERMLHVECQQREKKMKSELERYVQFRRIKRMKVQDGFIKFEFGKGEPKHFLDIVKETQAAITAYYEYLDLNMKLDKLNDITVAEILGVWMAIQYICREGTEQWKMGKGTLYTKEELGDMPRKIKTDDLLAYLVILTGIKQSHIKTTVEALEADWKRFNYIWTSPLYRIKTTTVYRSILL